MIRALFLALFVLICAGSTAQAQTFSLPSKYQGSRIVCVDDGFTATEQLIIRDAADMWNVFLGYGGNPVPQKLFQVLTLAQCQANGLERHPTLAYWATGNFIRIAPMPADVPGGGAGPNGYYGTTSFFGANGKYMDQGEALVWINLQAIANGENATCCGLPAPGHDKYVKQVVAHELGHTLDKHVGHDDWDSYSLMGYIYPAVMYQHPTCLNETDFEYIGGILFGYDGSWTWYDVGSACAPDRL